MAASSAQRGRSLPSGFVIRTGKWVWTTLWQVMMANLAPRDRSGTYIRPTSQFRQQIGEAPESLYPPAAQRYHLIVGLGCPWAHRTLITRALKGLEAAISMTLVSPSGDEGIWVFDSPTYGCRTLPDLYQKAQPGYSGRCTVPVLWDSQTETIVNNESAEIIVQLNSQFNTWATVDRDLYPESLRGEIETWNDQIYAAVNNGVYRCGFAQTQAAYDTAVHELFAMLEVLDQTLASRRYLCGDVVTLADVRLFTTLFRFDAVYFSLFKCNCRRIQDYEHLGAYLRDLYQLPGVAATCDLEAVKRDYYGNLFPLNPGGIIPAGSGGIDLNTPHHRDTLISRDCPKIMPPGERP